MGIGPSRLTQLHDSGIRTWNDVIEKASKIPEGLRANLLPEASRALAALEQK